MAGLGGPASAQGHSRGHGWIPGARDGRGPRACEASPAFPAGTKLSAVEFGNLQKMDGPTEQCQDPAPAPPGNCSLSSVSPAGPGRAGRGEGTGDPGAWTQEPALPQGLCEELLLGEWFLGCNALVDAGGYVRACQQDLCLCKHDDPARCACPTLAEYSRQCAHAGGRPRDWRGPGLCRECPGAPPAPAPPALRGPRVTWPCLLPAAQTCPHNMQHRECRPPCADTCSNPEHSQLCEDHCVAGCFCPEGESPPYSPRTTRCLLHPLLEGP